MIKILIIFITFVSLIHADSDCIFSDNVINYSKLINSKDLSNKKWSKKNKTFTAITKENEQLKVIFYTCHTYAIQAQLTQAKSIDDQSIHQKLIWLGSLIMSQEHVQLMDKKIQKRGFSTLLSGEDFDYIRTRIEKGDKTKLFIIWSM